MKVKTLRGKIIDMTSIMAKQGHVQALGNAKMNARGDKIANGKIVKTRHQMTMEYNQSKSNSVSHVPLHNLPSEVMSLADVAKQVQAPKKPRKLSDSE